VEAAYLITACPIGALVTAILIVNNLRDIPTDRAVGKRTLAVLAGERFAKLEYFATLVVAAVVPPVMLLARMAGPTVLLPLLAGVMVPPLVRAVQGVGPETDRRRLNLVLRDTARLSLVYAVLFAIGLAVRVGR
jgi:1,4-dihydroxy-2-naphthoate octaprenyltransferase